MASLFAAAGVAAALAASMTALVVPIDGARANPTTSNVIVVNPTTEPALTRNLDDPGRIAYQSSTTCDLSGSPATLSFRGYRKVIGSSSSTSLAACYSRAMRVVWRWS